MAEAEHQVAGAPPRVSVGDSRLKDMPVNLTPEAQSNYIKVKCHLADLMWTVVLVISKSGSNVRWKCIICCQCLTGAPSNIRGHFLCDVYGVKTCTAFGEERDEANVIAQRHFRRDRFTLIVGCTFTTTTMPPASPSTRNSLASRTTRCLRS